MLQCKKYTEAPGRASFIARFVAVFRARTLQTQQLCGYQERRIAAEFRAI
jgi:hypothetical protein